MFGKIFRKDINYQSRLTADEWGNIHNPEQVDSLVGEIRKNQLYVQTQEILRVAKSGESTLEIGSGSGQASICLAMKGCKATALDFAQNCLDLTRDASKRLGVLVETVKADATMELPFAEDSFDCVFHAGLLEHFHKEERIMLLKKWRPFSKTMISMVPNAACVAYRTGKAIMEKNGTWAYGLEMPLYSQIEDFHNAGFKVTDEYSIGMEHALNFLPGRHYLRKALNKWIGENVCEDSCGQGYLLVTIGSKY